MVPDRPFQEKNSKTQDTESQSRYEKNELKALEGSKKKKPSAQSAMWMIRRCSPVVLWCQVPKNTGPKSQKDACEGTNTTDQEQNFYSLSRL